jgi:threonine dehydratase
VLHFRGVKTDLSDAPPTWSVGLDCCVVSDLAWPTLRDEVNASVGISDNIAANGVRALHSAKVNSGESGAASTVGFLLAIANNDHYRRTLRLSSESHVLVFNTEGVTDPVTTQQILSATANATTTIPSAAFTTDFTVEGVTVHFSAHDFLH